MSETVDRYFRQILNGGNGTDTYIFAKGYGNDTINEWGSDHSIVKTTADLLEKMIEEQHISDANLRLLVKTVYVHQNEDNCLDVRLEFNGDFEDSVAMYVEGESA